MRERAREEDADTECAGLGFEGGLQGAFADENEDDGGELGGGESFDDEVETVPLDEPAGESEEEGGSRQSLANVRRDGGKGEFLLGDGVREDENAVLGDAVFLDAAFEMGRDGDDEAGPAEYEAVGPASEGGEEGLGADAGVADELVDLDDEGAAPEGGDEGGGEEEEGVALVDEVAVVAEGQEEVSPKGGDVVEELEEFEEGTGKGAGAAWGAGAGFGEGACAGGLAGIDAGGTRENDGVAHFLEGTDDAGDVDGFGAGAAGAEVVEEIMNYEL
jgi:hypothetical protein